MSTTIKISVLFISFFLMAGTAMGTFHCKKTHRCTKIDKAYIGFYKGVSMLDVAKTGHHKKYATTATSGFVISMPIVHRFKAETGIAFNHLLNVATQGKRNSALLGLGNQSVSIPFSVQYYFLPKNCRLQPYLGVGTLLYSDAKKYLTNLQNNEAFNAYPGTRSISILFTQGITFQINTKIHLTESLHFLNSGGRTTFGMSFGLGFYLP